MTCTGRCSFFNAKLHFYTHIPISEPILELGTPARPGLAYSKPFIPLHSVAFHNGHYPNIKGQ